MRIKNSLWVLVLLISMGLTSLSFAQAPAVQERVAAIKQAFQQSQQKLRTFEWIETITVSMKGEVKSQKQNRCYYGMDGVLQKVPVSGAPQEKKNEKLTDYMEQVVGLVKLYVPPIAEEIQKSVSSGNVSVQILEPGRRVDVQFGNYAQAGDSLTVGFDLTSNRILDAKVATYLGTPKDPVNLDVQFGVLNDGTIYTTDVTLDAPAKKIQVAVKNTGYRPV